MELTFNNQVIKIINHESEAFFNCSQIAKNLDHARRENALISRKRKKKISGAKP